MGAGARHRISRRAPRRLQTPSATPVTHAELPGPSARRRDGRGGAGAGGRPPRDLLSYDARHPAPRTPPEESTMRRMRKALWLVTAPLIVLVLWAGTAHAQKKTL